MPITTSKELDTIYIQVSTASGQHHATPIIVTAALLVVFTRVVETKPSTVQTLQNETAVRPGVFPTGSTNPSLTAYFKRKRHCGYSVRIID